LNKKRCDRHGFRAEEEDGQRRCFTLSGDGGYGSSIESKRRGGGKGRLQRMLRDPKSEGVTPGRPIGVEVSYQGPNGLTKKATT